MRAIVGWGLVLGACAGPPASGPGRGADMTPEARVAGVVLETPAGVLEARTVDLEGGGWSALDLLVGDAHAQERSPASERRASEPIDVRADNLDLDGEAGKAVFSGAVTLTRGVVTLSCDRLTATYGRSGEVVAARADGSVRLRKGTGLVATARGAELDLSRGEIVLEGPARLERPEGVVEGDRVVISLDRERVTVRGARGRFRIAAAGARP
ncbi:MAG: hypothetical protein HYY06_04690 [Deltaproteobacteria bacterium]|nr:hypothetical protein [Deltaproteobacteria bacterium]